MPPAAPAAPARLLGTPNAGANTRPAMSPMARNGTKRPPHPPATTAAVVAAARSSATASNVNAAASVVSAQAAAPAPGPTAADRSEEHTSELQSLRHLVCRLLLEKKKKKTNIQKLVRHR